MNEFTIIEDVFDERGGNQITSARGFVGAHHVPEDIQPRKANARIELSPELEPKMPPPPFLKPEKGMFKSFDEPAMYPGVDHLACRDVFTHVENCPLCKSYFRHDAKFYWLIIAILIVTLLLVTRKPGK